jgi:hypothetical protein
LLSEEIYAVVGDQNDSEKIRDLAQRLLNLAA